MRICKVLAVLAIFAMGCNNPVATSSPGNEPEKMVTVFVRWNSQSKATTDLFLYSNGQLCSVIPREVSMVDTVLVADNSKLKARYCLKYVGNVYHEKTASANLEWSID